MTNALPDSTGNVFTRRAPAFALPYVQLARLDRPAGWQLLLLPCWQSSLLASVALGAPPNWAHLIALLVGAVAMRGAGSTYNDIVDREIDAKVERTRGRPLPSGRVSVRGAQIFLVAQALVGLAAALILPFKALALAAASLAIVALYPFAKRFTSWPQAVLGLAFAWGALVGWMAETGSLGAPALLLYAGAICWTIGYDTIYAVQDQKDDPAAGVRSTARLFAGRLKQGVAICYALALVFAAAALWRASVGLASWIGFAGYAAHLAWQLRRLNADESVALMLFRSNRDAGLLLAAGLLVDAALRTGALF
jgi:4-hydroxybenzoate polyprenyltransferase